MHKTNLLFKCTHKAGENDSHGATDVTMIQYIFDGGAGLCAMTHSLSVLGLCCSFQGHSTLISHLVIVTPLREESPDKKMFFVSDFQRAFLNGHQQIEEN